MTLPDYFVPSWWVAQLSGRGPGARLARGSGTAFAVSTAGTLIVFANQAVLARVLGADAYGRYVYVVTWVGLVVILAMAGLNASAIRFVAEYRARGEWGLLRGFVRSSGLIVLGSATAVAVATALVVVALRPAIGGELARVFWVGCVLVPLWAALELRSASLRGFKRILAAQAPSLVLRPLLFAAGVLAVYFLRADGVTAPLAMWVNIAATVVALGVVTAVQGRQFADSPASGLEYRPREWLAVSLPLLLMAGFGIVLRSTDTIMLGFYRGTTEAGIYAVASRAAAFVPFMLVAVNTMAGPMISEYYAAGNRRALQRTLTVGARASGIFALAMAVFLSIGGGLVLGIFGPEFPSAHGPMIVLIGGQLVNCFSGSVGYLMTMTGHQNQAAVYFGSSAALNIGLNVLLVPRFGAMGAAAATASSMTVWNLAMLLFVLTRLRVNPTALPIDRRSKR